MILFRFREYGSASGWTEGCLEGELEELAGEALLSLLAENEALHVQRRESGEWEEMEGSDG